MTAVHNGTGADEVRHIEFEAAPARYARGWHCIGLEREFRDGKPHSIEAFGTKLVVWADSQGEIKVLDAYCRHMGGDLSQGTVKGDEVACPFHDWRWGGDGRCKQIPYARRVPLRARTRTWHAMAQDGLVFVWHDHEGNAPIPEQAIPLIDGGPSDPTWTDWAWATTVVNTNCREIIDNVVDMAHFFYVHHAFPTYFKNTFEGHTATQLQKGVNRDDMRPAEVAIGAPKRLGNTSVATYHGPSFMIDDLIYHYEHGDTRTVLINCHYPIDENSFMLLYGISMQRPEVQDDDPAAADALAAKMVATVRLGFEQDVEIWKNKTRIDNPLLCEEDGPVYQLRRWYEQFYVDVDQVTSEMTERFEFELDTTKPIEAWQREVEENVARRAEAAAAEAAAAAVPQTQDA
ncbi:Rieske 2Fe-2S domain-containing protein [Pimelobacter simplex]|uniref:Rieske 2Fe-2S domain-containing protein n=1 Tax=Nocardioides simplex TaxID=2045 RepID=UPI001933609B|nr:3-ketosteroid-9-alpha-hydroxylase subunit A [Pimelobacter simplex]